MKRTHLVGGLVLMLALSLALFAQVPGKHLSFNADRFWANSGVLRTDSRLETFGTSNGVRLYYQENIYTTLAESSAGDLTASVTGVTGVTRRALVGAITAPAAIASGNLVGTRGSVTMLGAATGGYLYGAQGKAITGAFAFSGTALAGIYGQLDVTGGTITSGNVAPIQSNLYGFTTGTSTVLTGLYVEHAGGGVINSLARFFGKSTYVFDIETNVHNQVSLTGTAGSTTSKGWLKILVDGVVRYIPLTDSVS